MFKKHKKKKAIKQFIKSINKNYKCYYGNTWSSLWTKGKLWYTFKKQEGDKEFLDYIEKTYHFRPDLFIFSLLHEIGHLETETQELSDARAIQYSIIELSYENKLISKAKLFEKYFKIEAEMVATQWAVDYYLDTKNHLKLFLLNQGIR